MIKNIIFDFGAVLLPINDQLSWDALDKLGAKEDLKEQTPHFRAYETGKLSTTDFLKKTKPFFFRKKIFSGDLKNAWNALLYKPLESSTIDLLKSLRKKGYKLYLLSNTNEMHISRIRENSGLFLYHQFISQFEEVYYSHEAGMRKPDPKFYKKVLKDHTLKAEECIFIDDKEENTEAAAKLGIKTWHFDPENDNILKLTKRIQDL